MIGVPSRAQSDFAVLVGTPTLALAFGHPIPIVTFALHRVCSLNTQADFHSCTHGSMIRILFYRVVSSAISYSVLLFGIDCDVIKLCSLT